MYTTKFPLLFNAIVHCMNDERDLITGQYNINHLYSKLHPQLIASSPALTIGYSYKYKQRFPLGEPSLLEHPSFVYFYLSNLSIVGNHEQEKVIATSDVYSHAYAMHILKNRFPLGEPVIAKSPDYSFWYAKFIGERFELGEPAIYSKPYLATDYTRFLLKLK